MVQVASLAGAMALIVTFFVGSVGLGSGSGQPASELFRNVLRDAGNSLTEAAAGVHRAGAGIRTTHKANSSGENHDR